MDRAALVKVFDHIIEGADIPTPRGMLRINIDDANDTLPGLPYSVATNLAHAVLWQEFWLKKLAGGPRYSSNNEWKQDFRIPDADEWPDLRQRFVEGLERARAIAASEPFDHQAANDDEAVETLVRIAVHGAYHCGQMNLLKRAHRASKKSKS